MGLLNSPAAVAGTIFSAMKRLFKLDKVTGGASVELWVVISTLLLVIRSLVESSGTRVYSSRFTTATVVVLSLLNYNMVDYTIGLMQLSAKRVNDYFQVWAVLLATLQCSVNVGRPYSRSRRIPLLDIMSSFWAANLLRVQTVSDLKIPLWLIWTLNASRVVSYFFSSDEADDGNQGNTRLVADYMRYEHTLSAGNSGNASCSTSTMCGYNYLVHGEDKVSRKILQQQRSVGPGSYRVQLNPLQDEDLITVEKIWAAGGSGGGGSESGLLGKTRDAKNRLKDVCLSFALHKLLRRRFYDLPMHEATVVAARDKIRRLVFEYVLENTENYERAFRVTEVELSFLRDTFYNRHAAAIFAGGLPLLRMSLSLSLILAIGYIAYPVRDIPQRIDPNDKNRIVHGVFVTRLLIALIVVKELGEIYIHVFAPPENGLVAEGVFNEVRWETKLAIFYHDRRVRLQAICYELEKIAAAKCRTSGPDEAPVKENQQQDGAVAVQIAAEEQIFQEDRITEEDPKDPDDEEKDLEEGYEFRLNEEPPHNQEPSNGGPIGYNVGFEDTIFKMASELGVQLIEA